MTRVRNMNANDHTLPNGALHVLKLGDERLRQRCQAIEDRNEAAPITTALWATTDYLSTLHPFTRGKGLAAPQLGFMFRVFIAEYEGVRRTFINPEIIEKSEEMVTRREGCLSFFDYRGFVPRPNRVKVGALSEDWIPFEVEAEGELSSLLQHEIDHLDGILYFDYLPNGKRDLILMEGMPQIP